MSTLCARILIKFEAFQEILREGNFEPFTQEVAGDPESVLNTAVDDLARKVPGDVLPPAAGGRNRNPNVLICGTGEYVTGLTGAGQSKSDKSLGVVGPYTE